MQVSVIREYQTIANEGYATPMTCSTHTVLDLLARDTLDGLELICPLEDHRLLLGLADYRQIEFKLQLAKVLKQMKGK